ncbi:MAG: peptidylprolyl isomerase [Akkermansiaceae bacterium]
MSRILFSTLLAAISLAPLHAGEVTGIAAKVNGRVITKNEVNYHLTPYRQQLQTTMPRRGKRYDQLISKARNEILDSLIERELILSEFRINIKATIPAHAIDAEINRQVRELYNNSRAEFNKSLKAAGVTSQQHRRETEKKLIVQAMRAQQFANAVPPLPSEVRVEYNKHKQKMRDITGDAIEFHTIYIRKQDPDNPVATPKSQLELAESIVAELKKGADFEELAKKNSTDAYADSGGKRGKTPRTELSPPLAAVLMETDNGKVLGPLEDRNGYTIVRVDKKHYGPAPTYSKARRAMESRVRARKNKAKHDRWMKRLRSNAMIKKLI